ncbi:FAD-dependent monooxygenase [Paraburkholderia bannensis]|uniref:FAD-dependent monooxygenase n=1 Tax=Paraburkholderia bannensis TaxID=765414 RepID=UPI002AB1BEF1|nr:FAD-dependent monooxygenase [Paraburkholderia bannensis]
MAMSEMRPVIIVGGGPVGLGAALELARCRVPSILIERNARTSWHPKTRNFNTRTMEIARGWGREVYDELRQLDLPPQWKAKIRFASSIVGKEVGTIDSNGFAGAGPELSPVSSVLSSQDMIEPVMLRQVMRSGMVDVRFNHEMVEFVHGQEAGADGVEIRVRDKTTGEMQTLKGSALIASDGASSSMRSVLGLNLEGTMKIAHFMTVYFKADIEQYVGERPGILLFIANEKARGVFQPLDARGRWLCQITVSEDEWSTDIYTPERCAAWIRAGVGVESLPVEVLSVGKWQMNAAVCNTLQVGNVLVMGDAAHMFPPTGGLGVNTGLQGMHNAIWKLALHVRGKAGRGLLETYTVERKPVAAWTAEQSYHNARQVGKLHAISMGMAPSDLSPEQVLRETRRYGNQIGLELGSIYESQAVVPDDTEPPFVSDPYTDYVSCGRPGHRAPHVWLRDGDDTLSTLDLVSSEFTVLAGPDGGAWEAIVARIGAEFGLEIAFHAIGGTSKFEDVNNLFCERYGVDRDGAVLVRPDGYVAWRQRATLTDGAKHLQHAFEQILA